VPERFVIDIDAPDAMTAAAAAPVAFQRIQQLMLPERQKAAEEEQQRNLEVLSRTPRARVNRLTTNSSWRRGGSTPIVGQGENGQELWIGLRLDVAAPFPCGL
jgi:hypothetical protein